MLVLAGCGGGGDPLEGDLLITAERVFDGRRVIEDGAVLVRGRQIVYAGSAEKLEADASRRIELGNATVLPGFIDLHVHGADQLTDLKLGSGVTTIRDLAAPISAVRPPRDAPGRLRILWAGPIVTAAPDGYPTTVHGRALALPVRGAAQARAAVDRLADRGAAVIKIAIERGFRGDLPRLSSAEVRAIVSEAHAHDLIVTAHVTATEDARRALEGGVDELAHMPCVGREPAPMRQLAERRIPIVATLHVEEEFGCRALPNARAFVAAGGRVLYGTDMGNPGIPFTLDVHELELLRGIGLSTVDVLRAATSEAGDELGRPSLGTLAEGAPADVFAVDGNPLADLAALGRPRLVVAGGRVVAEH